MEQAKKYSAAVEALLEAVKRYYVANALDGDGEFGKATLIEAGFAWEVVSEGVRMEVTKLVHTIANDCGDGCEHRIPIRTKTEESDEVSGDESVGGGAMGRGPDS